MNEHSTYKQLSNQEIAGFTEQMAMILQSGISALEGIAILREEAATKEGTAIMDVIYQTLVETGSVAIALKESGVFPSYAIRMVEMGEHSGKLDDVMHSLTAHYEREENIAANIRSAITYPCVVIMMIAAIVLIIITKVLPVFNQVYEQLGSQMSAFSKSLMDFGAVIQNYSAVFLLLLAVFLLSVFFFTQTAKGRLTLHHFSIHFFLSRKLAESIALAHFASGMYLALSSGLNIDEALQTAAQLTDHPKVQEKARHCQEQIDNGADFPQALLASDLFTRRHARMIMIGFKTGAIDEVMEKIAVEYETATHNRINRAISIIEPSLVAILAIVVGMILLSVMLPLLGIMSGIGV